MQNSVAPGPASTGAAPQPAVKKRKRRARAITWTIVGVFVFCLAVMGVSAFVAKSAVDTLMAEAKALATDIDDSAKTEKHVDEMVSAASRAHWATAHPVWRATEVLPVVGDDLRAVRLLARTADSLVSDVAAPLLEFDLSSIGPTDGALNVDAVAELGKKIEEVAPAAQDAQIRLIADGIETDSLLGPLQGPVAQVEDVLGTAADVLRRLAVLSPQLATMLGADEPRNYLVLAQNTAEMRSLGGNPGSLLMLTVDNGRMEITHSASEQDLNSGRAEPITPLNPWTEALYTDRVGRYIQDTTMTPDFAQTAALARAFWGETLGDPGDAVLAIDPVVLSYMLKATGPVQLPTGEKLTSDNVVKQVLNEVYVRYPGTAPTDRAAQDLFFAEAAGAVFGKLTSSSSGFAGLITQLVKGYEEGRILYAPTNEVEAKAVSGTRFGGPLTVQSNDENTTLGVFVNDNTEGKLDYYTDMSVKASSNVCSVGDADDKTFTVEATYNFNLKPEDVATLPYYVSTARYFPKGQKSTNLVFYGPVGSTYVSAKIDGQDFVPQAGTNDLGRQAVLINFLSDPASTHKIEVTFSAPPANYGPIDVRTTPMIKGVPVNVESPGCG
ncbi:hypothetical protein GCM10010910_25300 [Microbacterium nanhaiense]|uniref:DUF4012 domain-containing protein n=1 Tax=Microbacterium nanhaiense TaxID=1301026 RepID=A0ABQ2N3X1_9MICO|nr:DUF4012 domain-containing protein [Microbacterium nanhaiense]GGO66255.1 hypothetical protein GCM10010910_25300 [Microbacterium nanhaiense]